MAIAVFSTQRVALDSVPPQLVRPDEMRGRVRIQRMDYVTVSTTFVSGSTITGVALPYGARLVDAFIISDDIGGTSTTLKLTLNAIDIIPATNHGDGAAITRMAAAAFALMGDDLGGYAPIITSGASDAVADKEIHAVILYVVD